MSVDVDRIPALHLSLADAVFDDHEGLQRWLRVVALAAENGDVLVTCEGDDQVLRFAADALVAARRADVTGFEVEDVDMNDWISTSYPGDVDSAAAAVVAHARDRSGSGAQTPRTAPVAHYEGLYGGDLDAIIDALGATPDARTRVLREAATRRHLTEAQLGSVSGAEASVELDDDDLIDTFGDWYVADGGFTDMGGR